MIDFEAYQAKLTEKLNALYERNKTFKRIVHYYDFITDERLTFTNVTHLTVIYSVFTAFIWIVTPA